MDQGVSPYSCQKCEDDPWLRYSFGLNIIQYLWNTCGFVCETPATGRFSGREAGDAMASLKRSDVL